MNPHIYTLIKAHARAQRLVVGQGQARVPVFVTHVTDYLSISGNMIFAGNYALYSRDQLFIIVHMSHIDFFLLQMDPVLQVMLTS